MWFLRYEPWQASFCAIFCPTNNPKKWKKWRKKTPEISSFYTSAPKLMMTHENEKTKQNEKKEKNTEDITSWSDDPWDGSWYMVHNK